MGRYCYPAIFTEENKEFSVVFPDLPGCQSCGESITDALLMAEDALSLYLADKNISGQKYKGPSEIKVLKTKNNDSIHLIACDTTRYERQFNQRAIRKSVSIPKWLNDEAQRKGINFSEVLKNALLTILSE